jgi:hypothetical protein
MLSLSNPEIRFNLGTINWVVGLSGTDRKKTVIAPEFNPISTSPHLFFQVAYISYIRHVELAKHDGLRNQYPYEIF